MRVEIHGATLAIDDSRIDADAAEIRRRVGEYERGERTAFGFDVAYPDGFTGEVMRAIAAIPYGETRTYGDLAAELDTSPVAVGGACGRNPVPLVVPCHRVVAADGLGGYSGGGDRGRELKRRLLRAESSDRRVDLDAFG